MHSAVISALSVDMQTLEFEMIMVVFSERDVCCLWMQTPLALDPCSMSQSVIDSGAF